MCEAFSAHSSVTFGTGTVAVPTEELFRAFGAKTKFLISPSPQRTHFPKSMWFSRGILPLVHRAPPDTIFYCREPLLAFWLICFSRRFRKCFFYECHSLHRFTPLLYKIIFRFTRGIIVTTASKKIVIESWRIQAPILVEPNAIDLNRFAAMPADKNEARILLNLPRDKTILLYIGGFIPDRGIYTLLEAARQNTHENWYFLFAGGTEDQQKALAHELRHDHIHARGRIPYEEVPVYLAAADVLLAAPSKKYDPLKKYLHGSPLKIPEYMHAERPIVITDLPMIREWVSEHEVFFFEPDNAADLLRAVERVFTDPVATEAKVKRAKSKVLRHTWQQRAERIVSFIRTCTA